MCALEPFTSHVTLTLTDSMESDLNVDNDVMPNMTHSLDATATESDEVALDHMGNQQMLSRVQGGGGSSGTRPSTPSIAAWQPSKLDISAGD